MKPEQFSNLLRTVNTSFTPVIDNRILARAYTPIDLSIGNKMLDTIDINSSSEFEKLIQTHLKARQATVAYGGYLERRGIYDRSEHFLKQTPDTIRNIHIGLDLWCEEGTEVLSPLHGFVHSFQNNDRVADYGPTIILGHQIDNVLFYTLYGHMSLKSIQNISEGQIISKGQVIGKLGNTKINGDYAPHLHFQVIRDLGGNYGDYPGVSSREHLNFYKDNCPDPNLLLKIPHPEHLAFNYAIKS